MDEAAQRAAHVLAVDDEAGIRQLIRDYLVDHDFRVSTACDGREMRHVLARDPVDLLLLDLRMPGEDGLSLARGVRASSQLPIIILTGRHDEADRVMSLELAADDYLTKPFSPRELLARIRALLRRSRAGGAVRDPLDAVRAYRFAGWDLNVRLRRLASPSGEPVPLSVGEFNLLVAFLATPQKTLSRDDLLDRSRLHHAEVFDRSIDVQVGRLRRKLGGDASRSRLIVTDRGRGYRFSAAVEAVLDP